MVALSVVVVSTPVVVVAAEVVAMGMVVVVVVVVGGRVVVVVVVGVVVGGQLTVKLVRALDGLKWRSPQYVAEAASVPLVGPLNAAPAPAPGDVASALHHRRR